MSSCRRKKMVNDLLVAGDEVNVNTARFEGRAHNLVPTTFLNYLTGEIAIYFVIMSITKFSIRILFVA